MIHLHHYINIFRFFLQSESLYKCVSYPQDSEDLSLHKNASNPDIVEDEGKDNSEIGRLQLEIERKNNVLLQLKAELERQEDYKKLQEQYKYVYR